MCVGPHGWWMKLVPHSGSRCVPGRPSFSDEGEHVNLSEDPAHASTMASMLARLAALRPTLFNPNRSVSEAGEQLAKKVYFGRYGGFGGPFVFLEED